MALVPRLLLLSPPEGDASRILELLSPLSACVDAVILRRPTACAREVLDLARAAARVRPRPALLVSDRADIALAAGVEGVHLREDGLPPLRARELGLSLVGASHHPQGGAPLPPGADYLVVSPVFATTSKPGVVPLGLTQLTGLCGRTTTPVLALGGVDATRVRGCRRAGAHGVAVLSAVWSAPDPVEAAFALRRELEASSN